MSSDKSRGRKHERKSRNTRVHPLGTPPNKKFFTYDWSKLTSFPAVLRSFLLAVPSKPWDEKFTEANVLRMTDAALMESVKAFDNDVDLDWNWATHVVDWIDDSDNQALVLWEPTDAARLEELVKEFDALVRKEERRRRNLSPNSRQKAIREGVVPKALRGATPTKETPEKDRIDSVNLTGGALGAPGPNLNPFPARLGSAFNFVQPDQPNFQPVGPGVQAPEWFAQFANQQHNAVNNLAQTLNKVGKRQRRKSDDSSDSSDSSDEEGAGGPARGMQMPPIGGMGGVAPGGMPMFSPPPPPSPFNLGAGIPAYPGQGLTCVTGHPGQAPMPAPFGGVPALLAGSSSSSTKLSKAEARRCARMDPVYRLQALDAQVNGTSLDKANTITGFFAGMVEKLQLDSIIDEKTKSNSGHYQQYLGFCRQETQKAFLQAVSPVEGSPIIPSIETMLVVHMKGKCRYQQFVRKIDFNKLATKALESAVAPMVTAEVNSRNKMDRWNPKGQPGRFGNMTLQYGNGMRQPSPMQASQYSAQQPFHPYRAPYPGAVLAKDGGVITCWNCGRLGHRSSECQMPPRQPGQPRQPPMNAVQPGPPGVEAKNLPAPH